jgi:hypothetical protein
VTAEQQSTLITRRAALAQLMALTGSAVIGAEFFLSGCRRADKTVRIAFTPQHVTLLDEIGDTIIPTTDTPGAKSVGIGAFMVMIVNDCYDDAAHETFARGLTQIDEASRSKYDKPFLQCTPAERLQLLNAIDREARTHAQQKPRPKGQHYFKSMKDLTLLGYFSSQVGCTQALRYVESPGAYDGDVPYKKGEKAWFTPLRRFG